MDKGIRDKEFIWNPSNCESESDKSCDNITSYLEFKICKCRNKLVVKLVEECIENIDGNKVLHNETLDMIPLNVYKKVCDSGTIYMVLVAIFFICSSSV